MKRIWLLNFLMLAPLLSSCQPEEPLINPVASVMKMDVVSAEQIYLAGKPVELSEIHTQLKQHSADTDVYVLVYFSMDIPMGVFENVLQQVNNADVKGMAMSATGELDEEVMLSFYRPTLGS